ncbi:MAPEG family protein [Methyloceanibacter sp.]|uniref:MAPEG family protein n=1 Tax=Methyloceanibacter sp. TaxID=1965321 RepID=UPI003D6D280C
MQRTVEQRHSPKRRTSARRHVPAKTFGFTARQRPFIIVLVANWIFSLTFFLGMKLVWHWQPADWGIADRIALVLKDAVFALLPGVIGICIVAAQRLNPSMFVGQTPKPNSAVDINNRFILNTFEQFTAYFVANAGLAMYCPPEEARSLPLLTMLFVMGRILFWIGYHRNPYLRAFGFGITFYPTVLAFVWLMLIMVFGIRIPL